MIGTYDDLDAWQRAMDLVSAVYGAALAFPRHEIYGRTNQIRRAAVSIPSNIAEGKGRNSDKELRPVSEPCSRISIRPSDSTENCPAS